MGTWLDGSGFSLKIRTPFFPISIIVHMPFDSLSLPRWYPERRRGIRGEEKPLGRRTNTKALSEEEEGAHFVVVVIRCTTLYYYYILLYYYYYVHSYSTLRTVLLLLLLLLLLPLHSAPSEQMGVGRGMAENEGCSTFLCSSTYSIYYSSSAPRFMQLGKLAMLL